MKPVMRVATMVGGILAWMIGTANADEHFYVLIFGSQSHPKQFRYTHTWATFVRAIGEGPDPANFALEAHTISWLPETLDIRTWALMPEPGVNLDLEQSLAVVASNNENVTMWGPFLLGPQGPEIYARSLWVKQFLESGQAQYRAISTPRNLLISDCIHAVAAVDPVFGREHYPLIRIGVPASRYIARQVVTRNPVDPHRHDNSWLIPRLGLCRYPITVVPPQTFPKTPRGLYRSPD